MRTLVCVLETIFIARGKPRAGFSWSRSNSPAICALQNVVGFVLDFGLCRLCTIDDVGSYFCELGSASIHVEVALEDSLLEVIRLGASVSWW